MRKVELEKRDHNIKMGKICPFIQPTVFEDCILTERGETIGMYIKDISKYDTKLTQLLSIANKEFNSANVPKRFLHRTDSINKAKKADMPLSQIRDMEGMVTQYSAILGSVPKNPRLRRMFHGYSSLHEHDKARTFSKAMMGCSQIGMMLIKQLAPELYGTQMNAIKDVEDKWRYGKYFTSSISNYNISAPYHIDSRNIVGSLNIIYTKRSNSEGGCLNVPDYGATFEQRDNSMLVYPAWRNMHGVTPINEHAKGGYRNSLIFYSIKAFVNEKP